jgi:hypothetical protein
MLNKSIHQPHKQLVNIAAAPPNGVNQKKKDPKVLAHMCARGEKKSSDACW